MPSAKPTLAIVDFFNEANFEVVKVSSIDKDFGDFEDVNRDEVVVINWKIGKTPLKHHPARIVQFGNDEIQLRQQRNKIVDQCLSVKSLPLMFDSTVQGPRDRRPNTKYNSDEEEECSPEETAKKSKRQHSDKTRSATRSKNDAKLDVARRTMDAITNSTLNKENNKVLPKVSLRDHADDLKLKHEPVVCSNCELKDAELSRLKDAVDGEKRKRKSAEKRAELLEKSPDLVYKLCKNLESAQTMLKTFELQPHSIPDDDFFHPSSSCEPFVMPLTPNTPQVAKASTGGRMSTSSSRTADKLSELIRIGETVSIPKSSFMSLDRTDVTTYTNQLLVFVFGEEQIANSTYKAYNFTKTTKKPINQKQLDEIRAHVIEKFKVDAAVVNQKMRYKFGNVSSKSKRMVESHPVSNKDLNQDCDLDLQISFH